MSEIQLSKLERTLRFDSEFYQKVNLNCLHLIEKGKFNKLTTYVNISDGNHMSISEYFTDVGIPYYRGQDVHDYFIENATPIRIDELAFQEPYMVRSHLKKGDLLLSIVGTIGKLSLVYSDAKATCSCKLAILRPKKGVSSEFLSAFLSSKYGQNQIKKFTRGAVQMGLILEDMDQLIISDFSDIFQQKIDLLIKKAYTVLSNSKYLYSQAEQILQEELGLKGWQPSTENINVKSFKESFLSTSRLDAEYYQSKYDEIEEKLLSKDYIKLKDYFDIKSSPSPSEYQDNGIAVIKTKNVRIPTVDFENLSDYTNSTDLYIQKEDLLFASMGVGSLGRVSYIDEVINPATIDGTLKLFRTKDKYKNCNYEIPTLLFLTSKIGQELIYKYVIGSTGIISISKESIENLIIPIINKDKRIDLSNLVLESISLKQKSEHLLEVAKRAVEIAIEKNEDVAMRYIGINVFGILKIHIKILSRIMKRASNIEEDNLAKRYINLAMLWAKR